jgi:hypothetical protein
VDGTNPLQKLINKILIDAWEKQGHASSTVGVEKIIKVIQLFPCLHSFSSSPSAMFNLFNAASAATAAASCDKKEEKPTMTREGKM